MPTTTNGIETTPPLPPIIPSPSPILDSLDDSIPISTSSSNSPSPPQPPSFLQQQQSRNNSSSSTFTIPINNGNKKTVKKEEEEEVPVLSMTCVISDPQKHQDAQGAYVTYLVTTTVSFLSFYLFSHNEN